MNCQECRDHFGELLYAPRGEPLDDALAGSLRDHLGACPQCAGEVRELEHARSWLDVLRDQPSNAEMTSAISARPQVELYTRLVRLQRRRDAWRWAALATAAAAAVLLAAFWWPRRPTANDPPTLAANEASLTAKSSVHEGLEFQRLTQQFTQQLTQQLTQRLEEQDQVLRLLSDELQALEGRQGSRLVALEKQSGVANEAGDLQALRISAMQHDIDQMREFITGRKGSAQHSAD